jgi:hypothetical protein
MIKGSCANEVYDRIYWANGKLKFHMLIHKNAKDTVIRISVVPINFALLARTCYLCSSFSFITLHSQCCFTVH